MTVRLLRQVADYLRQITFFKFLDGLIGVKGKADAELNVGGIGISGEAGIETLDDKWGFQAKVGAGATPLIGGKVGGTVEFSIDPAKAMELAGDALELGGRAVEELKDRYGDDVAKVVDELQNPGELLSKGADFIGQKLDQGLEDLTEKIGGPVDSIKDKFDTLSDAEKKFLSTNLHLAAGFKDAADTADKMTTEAFGGDGGRRGHCRDLRSGHPGYSPVPLALALTAW